MQMLSGDVDLKREAEHLRCESKSEAECGYHCHNSDRRNNAYFIYLLLGYGAALFIQVIKISSCVLELDEREYCNYHRENRYQR